MKYVVLDVHKVVKGKELPDEKYDINKRYSKAEKTISVKKFKIILQLYRKIVISSLGALRQCINLKYFLGCTT